MSKKKNYYNVHKNKKPNKKLPKGLHPKVIECIRLATEVVNKAIRRSQMLAYLSSQSIPKYKLGSNGPKIVCDVITGEDREEYFVKTNGEKIKIPSPINFDKFNSEIKRRVHLASITSEELTKANNQLLEYFQQKNIKAPN